MDDFLKSLSHLRVICAEDEAGIRENLVDFLKIYFEEVYEAKDGAEALELFKIHKPDVVITDILMPRLDGIGLSKEIKKISKDTKIIISSAYSDTSYFQEAIDIGIFGYMMKPFNKSKIEEILAKCAKEITYQKNIEESKKEITEQNMKLIEEVKLEKEKAEEALGTLIQKLKYETIGEMVHVITHQWNNNLNSINLLIGTLFEIMENNNIESIIDDDELQMYQKVQNQLGEQVRFLAETIYDFKTFFKQDRLMKCSDFSDIVKKAINLIKQPIEKHNISVVVESKLQVEQLTVCCNTGELKHVVINLIKNAWDAIDSKISNDCYFKGLIKIVLKQDDFYGIVEIEDNGGGIPSELLDKIFEQHFTTKGD
ncbi:MAG: response regulator, partial [Campylobacterales bacterium]|nr:response regulator [Campylobacterales bacterium]